MTASLPPIQEQLLRTWPVFFARHGNLTQTQREAIPPILAGRNTLLVAATASGKTEAAMAPLLERHLLGTETPRSDPALSILYICPTRALVRDLYERLAPPLDALGVTLAMKSGDTGPVSTQRPPALLITTPESTDSLLTRAPRLLTTLRAVVLDEIHLFDGTARGDHLICLLKRIEHIRRYHAQQIGQEAAPLQRVALSATVADPETVAQRYLATPSHQEAISIVQVAGRREIEGSLYRIAGLDSLVSLLNLHMAGQEPRRKSLLFCNARNEVEQTAAFLRQTLPFAAEIFVHYSNLDPAMRQEVETRFAQASTAICVCTSTLELGIDIGSIELVALLGPPPSTAAFLQRIGRAGRRRRPAFVVGLARSPLEELRFQALYELTLGEAAPNPELAPRRPFCLSVLVQQTFSILKQSPTGGIRLADLRRVAPDEVEDETLHAILNYLLSVDYLKSGRLGEWRAGPALDELVDASEIYSNIGADPLSIQIVNAYSGQPIAQVERLRLQGEQLLLGGRLMEVVWRAQYRIGVRPVAHAAVEEESRQRAAPFAVSLDVCQAAATLLGFAPGEMALVQTEWGCWLFHFWGDIYGKLLAEMLSSYLSTEGERFLVEQTNEHCLHLPTPISRLPAWHGPTARRHLLVLIPRLEPFLELGRFHALLPPAVAEASVVEHVDLARLEQRYRAATVVHPTTAQRARLLELLAS